MKSKTMFNSIIIWQKWDSKEAHEAYVKFRHDDGSFDLFGVNLFQLPLRFLPLGPVDFTTDEQKIEVIITDMCNTDYKVGMKHTDKECVFIRPTGNPLNMEGWEQMMTSPDVKVESNSLIAINKMKIVGDMAYVCYTTHGKFNYKGTANDDIAVLTSVLQRVDGKWAVIHGQRSTGRKPSEELPKF